MNALPNNTITISRDAYGRTVTQGDRYAGPLGADEALFVVACLLLGSPNGWMKTKAEHEAYEAWLTAKRGGKVRGAIDCYESRIYECQITNA